MANLERIERWYRPPPPDVARLVSCSMSTSDMVCPSIRHG